MKWIILSLVVWFMHGHPDRTYDSSERTITAIRGDVRKSLRREALAAQAAAGSPLHVRSIGKLLALHGEIVRHSTFAEGQALPAARAMLQSRLVRIERRIQQREKQRREKQRRGEARDIPLQPGPHADTPPCWMDHAVTFLAQQLGGFGGVGNGAGGPGAPGVAGPGAGGLAGGGNVAGQLPDYGPLLAEIIRQVIDPASWQESGGAGTIVYYAPLRVFVVRATTEVHEDMSLLLQDLRAAGGP